MAWKGKIYYFSQFRGSAGLILLLVFLRVFHEATFCWELGQDLNIQDDRSSSMFPNHSPVSPDFLMAWSLGSKGQEAEAWGVVSEVPEIHFFPILLVQTSAKSSP